MFGKDIFDLIKSDSERGSVELNALFLQSLKLQEAYNTISKLLHIYGLTKTPVLANISSTYLSYQKGRISQNITFDHDASKLTNVKFESDNLLDPK